MNKPYFHFTGATVGRWAWCCLMALTWPGASLVAQVAERSPSVIERRDDINPALLYWQAYSLLPDLKEEEDLRVGDRHSVQLNKETKDLAGRFDQSFKLLRRAAGSRVFCDWGVDLSLGPEAMLPQLAKAKRLAQASTFRGHVYLAEGMEAKAIDDWVAAFVLGRQLTTDGILISALVQLAIENIIISAVAENYYRLSPEGLRDLCARLAAAPAQGSIAKCVATEKAAFVDWYIRELEKIRAQHGANEAGALAAATDLLSSTIGQDESTNIIPALLAAGGGTTAGLIKYFRSAGEPYAQLAVISALPYEEFQKQSGAFQAAIENGDNLLVKMFVPAVMKSRQKEFGAAARSAMLQAALVYRTSGASGLETVADPFGQGPFGFRRVLHEGIDRGFELKSQLNYRGSPEVLIFIEKAGPPLRVDGPTAGNPINATK